MALWLIGMDSAIPGHQRAIGVPVCAMRTVPERLMHRRSLALWTAGGPLGSVGGCQAMAVAWHVAALAMQDLSQFIGMEHRVMRADGYIWGPRSPAGLGAAAGAALAVAGDKDIFMALALVGLAVIASFN